MGANTFSAEELDEALDRLRSDGELQLFNEMENQDLHDIIYLQLEAFGLINTHSGDGHILAAGLTKKGLAFRGEGGFMAKREKEGKEDKLQELTISDLEHKKKIRKLETALLVWQLMCIAFAVAGFLAGKFIQPYSL